tara:strand:- start:6618 stop:7229 length:612 start_codon:yes stop_codon:yes gene_type:complete
MTVSIIIPYKEDRGFLSEAIASVHAQTFDGEIELIMSQSDNGVSYNLNRGIEIATGDYIKYLCDDDTLTPNSIKDSLEAIKGYDFIHGNAYNFFEGNESMNHTYRPPNELPTLEQMLVPFPIHGGSLMYQRDVFDKFGKFDESLTTGEEYEYNMRILSLGAKIGYCDNTLYNYRRHPNQKSLGRNANQSQRKELINQIRNRYV